MGSTRLPGKVLMKIKGKSILEHIIDRLKTSKMIDSIIVATTTLKKDIKIINIAKRCGVRYFTGDEDDVLDRYLGAAEQARADIVVRVTSDCPLVDIPSIDHMIKLHIKQKADYAFNINNTGLNFYEKGIALGLGAEVISVISLRKADKLAKKPYQREHVTIFLEEHPELFKILPVEAPPLLRKSNIRLTVDTNEDLKLIRKIYSKLYNRNKIINSYQVINLLEKNPKLLEINRYIKQRKLKLT